MKRYNDDELDGFFNWMTTNGKSEVVMFKVSTELKLREMDLEKQKIEVLNQLSKKILNLPVINQLPSDRFSDLDVGDHDDE